MKKIMKWFVPKERKLFEMLAELSSSLLESANELKNFVDNYANIGRNERKSKYQAIKDIKTRGDEIVNKIQIELDKNFRAPIKEVLGQLTILLDGILGSINKAGAIFIILSIERIDIYITKFIKNIISIVAEVNNTILNLKNPKNVKSYCDKIYSLEKENDDIHEEALSELFHFYKNSVDIIKYKEIYDLFEGIADKCRDFARVTESLAKNS